jgi:DNA-binding NtrC family response regulator/tetratricopeptide (TPR) repeat protein
MEPRLIRPPSERLIGAAPAIEALRAQIERLAAFDQVGGPMVPTFLIQGETGTGKGLVARIVHDSGPRAAGPFISVNCAAIPDTMLEAELFGFEAGSFTDARRAKLGLFEAASGGTLFLDEIDTLTPLLQTKLLTAIESKRVRRLGAVAERSVDVKLLAATQVELRQAVADGRFREDLYHRLAVLILTLPPLRERGHDVVLLAQAFLRQVAAGYGIEPKTLTDDALRWLHQYRWPGNVRELGHAMERVTLLRAEREVDARALASLIEAPPLATRSSPDLPDGVGPTTLEDEGARIQDALRRAEGNVVRAARLLGLSRDAIRWRMKRHGIARPPRAPDPGSLALAGAPASPAGGGRQAPAGGAGRPAEPAPAQAAAAPGWEQKTVAVLAIEVTWPETGSRDRPEHDPWTAAAHLERLITEKISGFGGVRLQHTPSLDLWGFGVPRALDQLPERALQAALAIRRDVEGMAEPNRPHVRLALHLGAAVVDAGGTPPTLGVLPVGETFAVPVRLLAFVEPGEVVTSSELERRLGTWVALEPQELGPRSHTGSTVRGYLVRGLRPPRARRGREGRVPLSRLVGRAQELGLLQELLTKVTAGSGQAVGIAGEPGSGKSRLLYELRQSLRGRRIAYVEGHCLAYASLTPYFPLIELLRDLCRVTETDSPEVVAARLGRRLRGLAMTPEHETPLLLELMGLSALTGRHDLDPGPLRARTFDTLRQILLNFSRRRPIVLAVENVHWIDPTSEAYFESLTDHLAGAPVMLLMTYRPGYRPSWLAKSWATQIALHPLSGQESRHIVRAVMGEVPLAPELEDEILAKAEGNPFFLEELARSLRDHGGRRTSLTIPNTIHAVLEARIDRLLPEDKRLLQAAAVIGREVPLTWLQPIAGLTDQALHDSLARLQATEFLAESRRMPERIYSFRHALIQAVAYSTLPPPQRRALHRRVLECVERLTDERRADHVGELAHHAAHAEAWDRAAGYFRQAAMAASERAAHREAAQCGEQALGALGHLPPDRATLEQEADIRFHLARALYSGGELGPAQREYERAEAAARRLGDGRRLAQVAAGLTYLLGSLADHAGAIAAGERALASAAALGDLPLQIWTSVSLGREYFATGEYRRGIERMREAIAALEGRPVDLRFQYGSLLPAVGVRTWLALCHARRGEFVEAIAWSEEAVRIAEESDVLRERVWAYFSLGRIQLGRGSFEQGRQLLERALPLCEGGRFPIYLPRLLSSLGVAYAYTGRLAETFPLYERAVTEAQTIGLLYGYAMIVTQLGDACLEAGRLGEARRAADEALTLARAHGERGDEAWVLHLVGGIDAAEHAGDVQRASVGFGQALALAEALEMRPLEARCRLGLALLHRRANQPAMARMQLERAASLFRAMDMRFWLTPAERLLEELR